MDRSAGEILELLRQPLRFGEAALLTGTTVREPLVLEGCHASSFDLSGSVFFHPVVFRNVTFTGLSWFKACRFMAGAEFLGSTFSNDARFDGSGFQGDFRLVKSEILGASDFSGCVFHGKASMDHSQFSGSLSLESADFHGKASLRKVECLGGFWAGDVLFADGFDARGMDVHGRTWLRNLHIGTRSGPSEEQKFAHMINSYGYQWA